MMFDPHNHLGGIVPYRVLALISDRTHPDRTDDCGGEEIVSRLLADSAFAERAARELGGPLTRDEVEGYLAHHEIVRREGDRTVVIKVKPDDREWRELVWVSPAVHDGDGDWRVAVSPAMAQLELILLARFFGLVRGMLEEAQKAGWWTKAPRLQQGSGILPHIIECMRGHDVSGWRSWLEAPESAPVERAKPLKRLLQNALTSTPLTDYDTAYVVRGLLTEADPFPGGEAPIGRPALLAAALRELARQGISYAEVSAGAKDIHAITSDEATRRILSAAQTRIGWLVQIPNRQVLMSDPDATQSFERSLADLTAALTTREALGFSILAPEKTDYGAAPEVLRSRLHRLLEACNAAAHRTVAHVHVGEGAAVWALDAAQIQALLTGKRAQIPPQVDAAAMTDEMQQARGNISAVLDALTSIKDLQPQLFERTRVRLGHVTHAGADQARRMKALDLWADVNLTSNSATTAWFLTGAPYQVDVKRLDAARYAEHGVTALAEAGVRFVLGTDGSGVEHSAIRIEFDVLGRVAASRQPPPDWVATAIRNAEDHVAWISQPAPADGGPPTPSLVAGRA